MLQALQSVSYLVLSFIQKNSNTLEEILQSIFILFCCFRLKWWQKGKGKNGFLDQQASLINLYPVVINNEQHDFF